MMHDSIYLTDELEMLRQQVRRFVSDEVIPHVADWDADGCVPREVLRRMGALGLFGIRYGEEYGGAGLDTIASVVVAEELGRSTCGGFTITALCHSDMASPHVARFGSASQRAAYMPGIVRGEIITAVAVTEPDTGSDVARIQTQAIRDGEHYRITGRKIFITNGVYADLYCVAARTDRTTKGSRGISMFLIERGAPGLTVSRKLDKMGWRASDTAELAFDDCPATLLGEENKGFYAIMQNFQNERVVLAAMSIGEAMRAIELTIEYVATRRAFDAPLSDKQVIRQRLAARAAEVAAARQLVYHVAWLDAAGRECVREVSMMKALCGELVNRVLYDCLQFHGGMGYMRESTIERMTRDARVHAIGGGATEVMLDEAAKRMMTGGRA